MSEQNRVSTSGDQALREATERAERAERELAWVKQQQQTKSNSDDKDVAHVTGDPELTGAEALQQDPMMAHLLDSLQASKDIGHYGRLVFTMIARHFLSKEEVIDALTHDCDFSDEQARQMLHQVQGRDYSPPRRERILEWQAEQTFPILPNPEDPDCGNVYKTLRFPKDLYEHIGQYQEEKAEAAQP